MKIKSTYFKKEFTLEAYEKINENNQPMIIAFHKSLEHLFYNILQCDPEFSDFIVSCKFVFIETSLNHNIVKCIITDNYGRYVEGIGESSDSTLDSEISKNYPTLMAKNRAFADALILYCGFSYNNFKIYSSVEMPEDWSKFISLDDQIDSTLPNLVPNNKDKTIDNKEQINNKEEKKIKKEKTIDNVKEDIEYYKNCIINFDKFKNNPITIEQLFYDNNNTDWTKEQIKKIKTFNLNTANKEEKEIIDQIKNIVTYAKLSTCKKKK